MRFLLLFLLLWGCSKPLKSDTRFCQNLFKTVTGVSQVVGSTLECQNISNISGDLYTEIVSLNICEPRTQGTLSDLVCPQLSVVVSQYAISSIPIGNARLNKCQK